MNDITATATSADADAKSTATLVYVLQAASLLLGITYLVAVIINYVKRSEVKGTLAESHFHWQIRTFWFSLLWLLIGIATAVFVVGYFLLIANTVWVIYRIAKGWLNLNSGKPMYQ